MDSGHEIANLERDRNSRLISTRSFPLGKYEVNYEKYSLFKCHHVYIINTEYSYLERGIDPNARHVLYTHETDSKSLRLSRQNIHCK